jgi:type VI protein secretion system component Hcp
MAPMLGRGERAILSLISFFLALSSAPAASLFLQVPGITGEQSPPGFPGAMAVQSLQITPDHFAIVKDLDSASSAITAAVVAGTLFPAAHALVYTSPPVAPPDASLTFQNVIATGQQLLGGGTEQDSFVATNPVSMFLELPGITGGSSTPGHPGIIQISSFTLSANQFSIIKSIDSATAGIMTAVVTGTPFATSSVLFYNSASPSGPPDSVFTFGTVVATASQIGAGGEVPSEQDTFAFASVPEPAITTLLAWSALFFLVGWRTRARLSQGR